VIRKVLFNGSQYPFLVTENEDTTSLRNIVYMFIQTMEKFQRKSFHTYKLEPG